MGHRGWSRRVSRREMDVFMSKIRQWLRVASERLPRSAGSVAMRSMAWAMASTLPGGTRMPAFDETRAIATRHGARIIDFERCGICEPARNAAIQAASNPCLVEMFGGVICVEDRRYAGR